VDNSGTRNQFLYITTLVADRLGQVTVCSYLPVHNCRMGGLSSKPYLWNVGSFAIPFHN